MRRWHHKLGQMMYWRLTDTLTTCLAWDRVLFLDVGRDRYFALPPDHNEAFAAWLGDADRSALPESCREILVQLAVIDASTAVELTPVLCTVRMPRPVDSARLPSAPIDSQALFGVGKAVISAWRDVRFTPLRSVFSRRLAASNFAKPDAGAKTEAKMRMCLAQFRAVRTLIPVPRVCLHDCLALLDWLGPARANAQLVLGVAAYPFAAHCWVQADGLVVDDHPESPSRFQPILHFP